MKLKFLQPREKLILCVSETWLLSESTGIDVATPYFQLFRCDQERGGGVHTCIFASNQLKTIINLSTPKQSGIEDVWIS